MKIVFDANVLVAAFAARGLCADLFEACLGAHECTASTPILEEAEVALRLKIRLPAPRAAAIRVYLEEHLHLVTPAIVAAGACRDPDDLVVLGTALAAGADCIVSGDKDLLALGNFQGIGILNPRALWDRISAR